jgi:hypothetical protein
MSRHRIVSLIVASVLCLFGGVALAQSTSLSSRIATEGGAVEVATPVLDANSEARVTFLGTHAQRQNTVGWYTIGNRGQIRNAEIIWANALDESLVAGETSVSLGTMPEGTRIGFFLIADGNNLFGDLLAEGTIEFRTANGRRATIFNRAPQLVHISADGVETVLDAQVFHSAHASRDRASQINPDELRHAQVGYDAELEDRLVIGFEDMIGQGDGDFDDVTIALELD